MIHLTKDFSRALERPWTQVDDAFQVSGEVFREPRGANRRTLRFFVGDTGYFLKLHWGVGWREIFKNLGSGRLPVLGAANEWKAIMRLHQLGVETMQLAAWGQQGWNPARRRSFVVTRELANAISLEDYCAHAATHSLDPRRKRLLIRRVAEMTRKLHRHGVNHRDLYICHFLLAQPWSGLEADLHLHLIDLHRVQLRRHTPQRWKIKDVAALYFSVMEIGLTQRDLWRFLKHYHDLPLRVLIRQHGDFLRAVERRALALKAKGIVDE